MKIPRGSTGEKDQGLLQYELDIGQVPMYTFFVHVSRVYGYNRHNTRSRSSIFMF